VLGGGAITRRALNTLEGKWGIRAHPTQEMKGKEGPGDLEGQEAKSRLASSRLGLDTSCEKGFFADEVISQPGS